MLGEHGVQGDAVTQASGVMTVGHRVPLRVSERGGPCAYPELELRGDSCVTPMIRAWIPKQRERGAQRGRDENDLRSLRRRFGRPGRSRG